MEMTTPPARLLSWSDLRLGGRASRGCHQTLRVSAAEGRRVQWERCVVTPTPATAAGCSLRLLQSYGSLHSLDSAPTHVLIDTSEPSTPGGCSSTSLSTENSPAHHTTDLLSPIASMNPGLPSFPQTTSPRLPTPISDHNSSLTPTSPGSDARAEAEPEFLTPPWVRVGCLEARRAPAGDGGGRSAGPEPSVTT